MDNLRGALLMVLAMAGFSVEDALIKLLAGRIPPGQIIAIIGIGGASALILWQLITRQPVWTDDYLNRKVLFRTMSEVIGTLFFVSALAVIPLTTASAVIQATPLVVATGAALFLGQAVGWRRWLAIIVGFIGVLVILRPGTSGFSPLTLLAIGGMLGLASRDLATRAIDGPITGVLLSIHALVFLVPAGFALMAFQGHSPVAPTIQETLVLVACVIIGLIAYLTIVAATRIGDAAVISSFRYSRMVFAIGVAFLFFREVPDLWTMIGVAIVIGAGVFTLWREARARRTSP